MGRSLPVTDFCVSVGARPPRFTVAPGSKIAGGGLTSSDVPGGSQHARSPRKEPQTATLEPSRQGNKGSPRGDGCR